MPPTLHTLVGVDFHRLYGRRPIRMGVVVVKIDERKRSAMVLGSDGELYGPVRWSLLKTEFAPMSEDMGRAWSSFRQRERASALVRTRLTQFLLRRRNRPPPPPPEETVLDMEDWDEVPEEDQATDVVAVPPLEDVDTAPDAAVNDVGQNEHVRLVDTEPPPEDEVEVAVEEEEDNEVCSVCLTSSPMCHASPCGLRICGDCTILFIETRFTTPPTTTSVPCPCFCFGGGGNDAPCKAALPWRHVAASVDGDTMDRLVALYGAPPTEAPQSKEEALTLEDCVDRLNTMIRTRLETA